MEVFSVSDIEALNAVLDEYGKMTWWELSDLSHSFPEWTHYEAFLNNTYSKNGYKIDTNLFFENRDEENGIFKEPSELLELTKEMYLESL